MQFFGTVTVFHIMTEIGFKNSLNIAKQATVDNPWKSCWILSQDSDEAENEEASSDEDYTSTRRRNKRRRKAANVRQSCVYRGYESLQTLWILHSELKWCDTVNQYRVIDWFRLW